MQRRAVLTASLAAWAPLAAQSQTAYPTKPIKLIIGFPPGGGIDFTARTLQTGLETALGQPLVIEYRAGAGGVIAATDISRAAADGYTLLMANTGPFAIAPFFQAKRPYDPTTQFSYLGQVTESSYIAATRADHPAKDLKQFVDWAKANPGKGNFASGGPGTSTHLNGELLCAVAGVDLLHVPYKGSAPAVTDLIGGQAHLLIDAGTALLPHIASGRLKGLAVTGAQRDPNLPQVPTVRELGLGDMESVGFQGIVGPAGLPKDVVDRWAAALRTVLANPEVKAKFAAAGSDIQPRGPLAFAAFVKAEATRWSGLIARRNIKLD